MLWQFILLTRLHLVWGSINCNDPGALLILNNTADDLEAARCRSLNCDIQISSPSGSISLDGLQEAGNQGTGGGLHAWSLQAVTGINSNSMSLTGAWFDFHDMPVLTTLSFPNLSWVGLEINIHNTPLLRTLETAPIVTVGGLSSVYGVRVMSPSGIIANTSLSKIDGLFAGETFDITIIDNPELSMVRLLPDQVRLQQNDTFIVDLSGNLTITNNAPEIEVYLPNLFAVAGNIFISNCSVLSVPSLSLLNASLKLNNASFDSFSAPALEKVYGDLTMTGAFTNISFPILNHVSGNLNIRSSNYINCTVLRQLYINGGIQGTFTCEGARDPPPAASTPSTSSSGMSVGAKAGIAVGAVVGTLVVLGTISLLLRRRSQRRNAAEAASQTSKIPTDNNQRIKCATPGSIAVDKSPVVEAPVDDRSKRSELEAMPSQVSELEEMSGRRVITK